MVNYYMILTSVSDYACDVKNKFKFAGFPDRYRNSIAKMKKGDKIIYYVTRVSTFCAVVEVTGESYYSKTEVWDDMLDPCARRVPTKPILYKVDANDGVKIKSILNDLDIIVNKICWGVNLSGSYRKLSKHDYELIYDLLNKK